MSVSVTLSAMDVPDPEKQIRHIYRSKIDKYEIIFLEEETMGTGNTADLSY